ncbi:tyrosine-type recombinase/integrase [Hespellia stercorisuis]|uniref:Site-specific recombinase XerD n=1 Tax=Hespellia stercorisuis DSM 15480 TaxID=1121950 RepID=A0A1M6WKX9_9FIRM|nr:tyrosine-type recombinase/integrase [Hespellia stercorisuis]SHK94351.1 Site-specific recombinase XerD [Hespellia stercorisuis DSM 15480]
MYEKYFEQLKEECLIRNRSSRTVEAYIANIKAFMKWTGNKTMEELSLQDAREFILFKRSKGIAASTCNFYNSSICFLYKHVLHIPWDQDFVPRMKLDTKLPTVLSLAEVETLIDTATHIRNKAIIALLYSSGLRVGELIRLQAKDIYASRMQVYVPESKNHRDRWTILSNRALELLTAYWKSYPIQRENFFVALDEPHMPVKVSAVEIMIRAVAKEAGLTAHPHTLRHSFASHMIENGVPINYVQAMLGHRCLESTQVYIHISNKTIMGIQSPLDHPQKKKRGRKPKKKDGDSNE